MHNIRTTIATGKCEFVLNIRYIQVILKPGFNSGES